MTDTTASQVRYLRCDGCRLGPVWLRTLALPDPAPKEARTT